MSVCRTPRAAAIRAAVVVFPEPEVPGDQEAPCARRQGVGG